MSDDGKQGLAWPDHDTGPAPPPEYQSRERDEERRTRKPLAMWDRIKILVLLLGAFAVLAWAEYAEGIEPLGVAFALTARAHAWLLVLAGLEFARQLHYLISERSARYHRFWTQRIFGGFARRTGRMNDWNRYRISRALKWILFLVIFDLVLARFTGESPAVALMKLPGYIWQALPMILQAFFIIFLAIIQFVAIFWFLSKGGVDVYFPDDIKTRYTDVWGQDKVLEKVKENMVFLEDPESIERKGGYVPGGVLLWGP
ncbi:MAG TPA: ATPase, partial [Actinomycetota bacterium]|nr:ATPase [Actinomycetota bacterium]